MGSWIKVCKTCGVEKSLLEFPTAVERGKTRHLAHCRPCKKEYWRKRDIARLAELKATGQLPHTKRIQLQALYGITTADYERMAKEQNDLCAICQQPEIRRVNGEIVRLAVDHNHATGQVRALLCHRCNSAIGLLDEDASRLRAAASYLEAHGS